jgi:acetyl-CoA C-acetyltransferase
MAPPRTVPPTHDRANITIKDTFLFARHGLFPGDSGLISGIVGVGQFVERLDDPGYRGLSPADIAAAAAKAAIADAAASRALEPEIGIVGGIRTFEDSTPVPAPFGKAEKYALAVASRLDIHPHRAILEKAGGNSPLSLLVEVAERIRAGESTAALIFGPPSPQGGRAARLGRNPRWRDGRPGART